MGNVCNRSVQSSAVVRCTDIILTQAETAGCQQELEDKIRNLAYTEAVLYMGNYFIHPNRLMTDELRDLFQSKRFYDFWLYNSNLLPSNQDSSKRKGFVFKVSVQASNSCDGMSQRQGKCPTEALVPMYYPCDTTWGLGVSFLPFMLWGCKASLSHPSLFVRSSNPHLGNCIL